MSGATLVCERGALFTAARRNRLEFLPEVVPSTVGPVDDEAAARIIRRFCAIGVHPDCWKLAPFRTEAAWGAAVSAIEEHDPHTRGIVALGLDAPEAQGGLVTAALIVASNFALYEQRLANHVGWAVVHARNLEIAEALNASLIAEDRCQIWGAERKVRGCLNLLFERGILEFMPARRLHGLAERRGCVGVHLSVSLPHPDLHAIDGASVSRSGVGFHSVVGGADAVISPAPKGPNRGARQDRTR